MYAVITVIRNDNKLPDVMASVWDTKEAAIKVATAKYCDIQHDYHIMERVTEHLRSVEKIGFGSVSFHIVKV